MFYPVRLMKRFKSSMIEHSYVPKHKSATTEDVLKLKEFMTKNRNILVLTGAGISTESGIPDYRSEGVGLYDREGHRPMTHQEFVASHKARQRYWARSYVAFDKFSRLKPNITHKILSKLKAPVVTQNVDRLHHKAGTEAIELHGTLYRVVCLKCAKYSDRFDIQDEIQSLNPDFKETATTIRPDGDVDISESKIGNFRTPRCRCGGDLKPDVVFFGDNVPRNRVDSINDRLNESDALLVLGSSLSVFSAYRIALRASETGKEIGIVNIGKTRGDDLADFKISARCGDILPTVVNRMECLLSN